MKLHSFIIAIATLVVPMTVIAQSEEEMFGKYPYCAECTVNYKDNNGDWYYSHHKESWCKVEEKKCQEITCGPVKGFPCCNDTSTTVSYTDADGDWGVENKKWCLVEYFEELDIGIELNGWLDIMPGAFYDKGAQFLIFLTSTIKTEFGGFPDIEGITEKHNTFKENYEIVSIELNGHQINDVNYDDPLLICRFSSLYYELDNNTLLLIFKDKKNNKKYNKKYYNFKLDIVE